MRCLVDTQIFIWSLILPEKLSRPVMTILQTQEILVSQVSLLEIAIKQKIGKLPELNLSATELSQQAEQDGFRLLALQTQHINAYADIPLLAEHRDPFDRLLLAIAYHEKIPFISADSAFEAYSTLVKIIGNA